LNVFLFLPFGYEQMGRAGKRMMNELVPALGVRRSQEILLFYSMAVAAVKWPGDSMMDIHCRCSRRNKAWLARLQLEELLPIVT
jgi:hypothetical protein